jgi:hypothetical protein
MKTYRRDNNHRLDDSGVYSFAVVCMWKRLIFR